MDTCVLDIALREGGDMSRYMTMQRGYNPHKGSPLMRMAKLYNRLNKWHEAKVKEFFKLLQNGGEI
jgi:hypothetical protein